VRAREDAGGGLTPELLERERDIRERA
jgi:hypothetical protein